MKCFSYVLLPSKPQSVCNELTSKGPARLMVWRPFNLSPHMFGPLHHGQCLFLPLLPLGIINHSVNLGECFFFFIVFTSRGMQFWGSTIIIERQFDQLLGCLITCHNNEFDGTLLFMLFIPVIAGVVELQIFIRTGHWKRDINPLLVLDI